MSATDAVKLLKGDEGGTCDWGDCDNAAVALRKKGAWPEWLPVCPYHLPDVFFQPIVIEAWEAGLSRSIEGLDLSDEAINLSAVSAALIDHELSEEEGSRLEALLAKEQEAVTGLPPRRVRRGK